MGAGEAAVLFLECYGAAEGDALSKHNQNLWESSDCFGGAGLRPGLDGRMRPSLRDYYSGRERIRVKRSLSFRKGRSK
jgi:hypothetical protein